MFEVPTIALVAESDLALTMCVTMTTTPPRSTIVNEVELSLTTADGTGKQLRNYMQIHIHRALCEKVPCRLKRGH